MRIERLAEHQWSRLRATRLAALKDAPDAFGSTYEACLAWPPARWQEQLRTLPTFVAVADGTDVGMVRGAEVEHELSLAYLISMWVAPQARRQGVGAALVDAVVDWALSLAKTDLYLDVRHHNQAATALYERKGFHPTGKTTPAPPPNDHLIELQYHRPLRG